MRKYGLIGYPLSHSFSQKYFTDKFREEGRDDCVYENFPLTEIRELPALLQKETSLHGLNVTIPYKEQVLPFLEEKDPVVAAVGACNCIKITGGKLRGFNTDTLGFRQSVLQKLRSHHTRALILGTGGASKAVEYVLCQLNIPFSVVSRNGSGPEKTISYQSVTGELLHDHPLVINTTPLGMFPRVDEYPSLPYEAVTKDHLFFDLVYNPAQTSFLKKAAERGADTLNGADMLAIQAEESWKIWNDPAL